MMRNVGSENGVVDDDAVRVVVVDDQELFRRGLAMLLAVEPDIEVVGEAGDGVDGDGPGREDRCPTWCCSTYGCRSGPACRRA